VSDADPISYREISEILSQRDGRFKELMDALSSGTDVELTSVDELMGRFGLNPTQARKIALAASVITPYEPEPGTDPDTVANDTEEPDFPGQSIDDEMEDMAMAAPDGALSAAAPAHHLLPLRPHRKVRNAIILRGLLATIGFLVLFVTVSSFLVGFTFSFILFFLLYVIFLVFLISRSIRYCREYRWEFDDEGIASRGAVFPERNRRIGFVDIERIDVEQSWTEGIFDLHTIRLRPRSGGDPGQMEEMVSSGGKRYRGSKAFSISGIRNVEEEMKAIANVMNASSGVEPELLSELG